MRAQSRPVRDVLTSQLDSLKTETQMLKSGAAVAAQGEQKQNNWSGADDYNDDDAGDNGNGGDGLSKLYSFEDARGKEKATVNQLTQGWWPQ